LAGFKKVQQQLAKPGQLELFLDKAKASRLRTCFAGQYGLESDDEETRTVVQEAIEFPEKFVLKPQREGGGNNIWGKEISEKLTSSSIEERSAFILMRRIMVVSESE